MSFISQHKLIVILGTIVILGVAWFALSGGSAPAPSDLTTTSVVGADPASQALVATLTQLRAVQLSGTIFSNPVFLSLKDFTTAITPEPAGRPNPFAPLTSNSSAVSTSTRGSTLFTPRK